MDPVSHAPVYAPAHGGHEPATSIRELAERHWNGEGDLVHAHHPVHAGARPGRRGDRARHPDDDLGRLGQRHRHRRRAGDARHRRPVRQRPRLRRRCAAGGRRRRCAAAVYSHHHIDHVFGTRRFEAEAAERGWPPPVVYAHEDLPDHFRRYERTLGWNTAINQRQFASPSTRFALAGRRTATPTSPTATT